MLNPTSPGDCYLRSDALIDWQHPEIIKLASELKVDTHCETTIARRCFEWVRDEIRHSIDFHCSVVTCRASDVLAQRTGFCYAKAHLLAALLRANGLAAGFCYQRLRTDNNHDQYCLHGLSAVYLTDYGWYRMDARGNNSQVNAQFSPPTESLAFAVTQPGEKNFKQIFAQPLAVIANALQTERTTQELSLNLPDWDLEELNDDVDSASASHVETIGFVRHS